MQEIIAFARQLGAKIAAHPRTRAFTAAARAVAEDREAQNLLVAYQDLAERLHALEAEQKPIEPADKHKLADLQSKVAAHPKLREMLRTQADYLQLLQAVQATIDQSSQAEPPPDPSGRSAV